MVKHRILPQNVSSVTVENLFTSHIFKKIDIEDLVRFPFGGFALCKHICGFKA